MNNEMSLYDGHHSSTHLDQSNLILLPLCLVLSAIYFELLLLLFFVAAAITVSNICTVEPTKG